ncbi:sodium:proton antiporter [Nocardioides panacis]|uniref:Sodium:proton antiporter n=1 Tax=Nocardioides panacis TaxID=2849501 RepID=A0A975SZC1_9ACTN|nr:DUF6328 family protein [Nocardioides panacis]QWZ08666.1 sodium:proton antiporter [Nocardioides panacis]
MDRNWDELLQELRVTQTGLQILTGFLVSIPFQQRFSDITSLQQTLYLGALAVALTATLTVLAPASFHRLLFRQQEKEWLVRMGNRFARAGLALSAVAIALVAWLLFDVVLGRTAGQIAVGSVIVLVVVLWYGVPLVARRRSTVAGTPHS